jgi:MFS family permease
VWHAAVSSWDGAAVQPDFRRFRAGQTISQLGSSFTQFATPLLVYKLTHSAVNLGVATAAEFLPYLLFGLVIGAPGAPQGAGLMMDRLERKRMMIDLARGGVIAAIPILAAAGRLQVWEVYAVGFASSTLTIFFEAGQFAAIPSLVGDVDRISANGNIQATYSAAAVLGPLLAGLLITIAPVQELFWVDAASFAVSALALATVRAGFNAPGRSAERTTVRRDIAEGLRYVLGHPVLRNISLMMAMINFVVITPQTQLVLFAKQRLAASDARVGFLFSAGSLGIVVMGLVAGRLRRRLRFAPAALGSLMLMGAVTVVFAFLRLYWAALAAWAVASGVGIFFNINTVSLRQRLVPNHLLGRVISIAGVLAWSAIPLGSLLGGWLIHATRNVAGVYAGIGVVEVLIAGAFLLFSPLGHAEDELPSPGTATRSGAEPNAP